MRKTLLFILALSILLCFIYYLNYLLPILDKWQSLSFFISAFGAIILAIVALFQDTLRAIVWRPKLELATENFYPDSEIVPLTRGAERIAEAVYLQIPITNSGNATAEKVEVYLENVEREQNGAFHKISGLYPMDLRWRHTDRPFLERISPHTTRDCTVGFIVNPANRNVFYGEDIINNFLRNLPANCSPLNLVLDVIPNTRCDLLMPGKYHLYIEISASNIRQPNKRTIELDFTGEWLESVSDMIHARLLKNK